MGENPRLQEHLFGGAGFPLDDRLCGLVVLVRHGAGEGGHSLTVTDVEANVWVGYEELYDDAVLVADGNVDGCSAFRILAEDKGEKKKGFKRTPLEPTGGVKGEMQLLYSKQDCREWKQPSRQQRTWSGA